jgi:hypothetical protein
MASNQLQTQSKIEDDVYIKIWETEQEFVKTRWTVTTFFMSASFAILAFSFQEKLALPEILAIRFFSLLVYWFAYAMYLQFFAHTTALRTYLLDMETSGRTTLDIQSKVSTRANKKPIPTSRFLLCFGLIYTIGIVSLLLFGL